MKTAMLTALALFAALAQAAQPDHPIADLSAYQPLQILPDKTSPTHWEFDLDPALQQARREGRNIYLVLSAWDCHFCARYEHFLARNAKALAPPFRRHKLLFVYLPSALEAQGQHVYLKAGGQSRVYADFQRALGDERTKRMVYPVIWLLDPALKNLSQLPYGTGTFETVEDQLEVIGPALVKP
ncbi:hypothetical protein HNP55_004324 [Paucibacter oligotrophus]|uniref:Thioredoxin-like protein n=1 Tax=Roseateles oligotrophus TaxID=1769250 RepID=A0A840LGN8_9BURK|nr:thioredoxin family protein [Roseateles oligotrophus]MBB4845772.1 hypothetical protein [Roseateles oligotrophus]